MIFFSEKKLARKLHEGQVTEKEQMIYLSLYVMTCVFFTTMSVNHATYHNTTINAYSYLFDFVTLTFTFGTIFYCSFLNRQGDGKNLITRYICVSVPLVIKFTPLLIIMAGIGSSLDNFLDITSHIGKPVDVENQQEVDAYTKQLESMMQEEGPFLVLLYALFSSFLMWRYGVAFKIASGKVELK